MGRRSSAACRVKERSSGSIRSAPLLPIFTVSAAAPTGPTRRRDWCCQATRSMGRPMPAAVRVMERSSGSIQTAAAPVMFTVSPEAATGPIRRRVCCYRAARSMERRPGAAISLGRSSRSIQTAAASAVMLSMAPAGPIRRRGWYYWATRFTGRRQMAAIRVGERYSRSIQTAAASPMFTVSPGAATGPIRRPGWCYWATRCMGRHRLPTTALVTGRCLR